jgi:hypothetical protein
VTVKPAKLSPAAAAKAHKAHVAHLKHVAHLRHLAAIGAAQPKKPAPRKTAAKTAKKPATAKKKVPPKKKAALPAAAITAAPRAVLWLPGCNDLLPTCATAAVANHLYATAGIAASDRQLLALHELAGGDDGARIETVLEAAVHHGLAGIRLASFGLAEDWEPGLVCGIATGRGYHAVLAHPYGMVSWGLLLPRSGTLGEAWELEWEEPG